MSKIDEVKNFWEEAACGEELYLRDHNKDSFDKQSETRYKLEPYIIDFADFSSSKGKNILEIGVGIGADHIQFAKNKCNLWGIDLTQKAIDLCKRNLDQRNLYSQLSIGNAEELTFEDNSFNMVYSWGVIHHSPNTEKCISEIHRVLEPGGDARIMVYNYYSIVGFMLWVKFGLFRFKPFTKLKDIYSENLESPGTKAYTKKQIKRMFSTFSITEVSTTLTHADLLTSNVGQRYRESILLSIAKKIWPATLIRFFFPNNGLFLLIKAKK
jgi:ubiquinone/menaquinone biosynthesis C-methylase UbiE